MYNIYYQMYRTLIAKCNLFKNNLTIIYEHKLLIL